MSINDIQNELNSLKTISESTNDCKTITDVLRNNIENIERNVDSRVINIYSRPWNKLEVRLKKKKIRMTDFFLLTNKGSPTPWGLGSP